MARDAADYPTGEALARLHAAASRAAFAPSTAPFAARPAPAAACSRATRSACIPCGHETLPPEFMEGGAKRVSRHCLDTR